jgi:hypothetical protein
MSHGPFPLSSFEPRGILSHHVSLQYLLSEMTRLTFLHECPHGMDDTPLRFCVAVLPFVSSISVFLSFLVSLSPPVCECGAPPPAYLNHKVRRYLLDLFLRVRCKPRQEIPNKYVQYPLPKNLPAKLLDGSVIYKQGENSL